MKKKLGAVIATAAAAFALLPATDALAAHNVGKVAQDCYNAGGLSDYQGVRIALVGLGQDHPRNGVVAARAKMELSAACNNKGHKVKSFTITSVSLVSAGGKVFARSGSLTGRHSITKDTKGIKVGCGISVHAVAKNTIRYANGVAVSGTITGNSFKRC